MSRLPNIDSDSKDSKCDEKESLSALSSNPATLFNQGRVSSLESMLIAQLGGLPKLLAKLVEYNNKDEKDEKTAIKNQKSAQKIWDLYGQQIVDHFLLLVAQGKQNEAEEMVKIYPDLIFASGNVTDYSGRFFENITAWKYALWALDSYMWNMLLKYIPQDQKPAALEQLKDLETQGVTYTLSEKFIDPESKAEQIRKKMIKESHYHFSPLIDALEKYVEAWGTWDSMRFIKEVGSAQRMVPVHVANEYCCSFNPPHFGNKDLPRTLRFYNYATNYELNWFPLSSCGTNLLGVSFFVLASHRGRPSLCGGYPMPSCYGVGGWQTKYVDAGYDSLVLDLRAVTALRDARHEDLLLLTLQLQNSSPQSVTSPSACLVM